MRRTGLDRTFLRTLVLAVDLICIVLPVGLRVAMFSPHHRRLGDMVGETYVVRKLDVGRPVVPDVPPVADPR
jgi:uncharacterized RDD family membrane protein YckC